MKAEWVRDNIEIGNFHTAFTLLSESIGNNPHLTDEQKKRAKRYAKKLEYSLTKKVYYPTFKETG